MFVVNFSFLYSSLQKLDFQECLASFKSLNDIFQSPQYCSLTTLTFFLFFTSEGSHHFKFYGYVMHGFCIGDKKNAVKRSRQHARIQLRSSFTEGHLPPKVVFHRRSSSTEGHLPAKVFFYQRCLPSKVVFH